MPPIIIDRERILLFINISLTLDNILFSKASNDKVSFSKSWVTVKKILYIFVKSYILFSKKKKLLFITKEKRSILKSFKRLSSQKLLISKINVLFCSCSCLWGNGIPF